MFLSGGVVISPLPCASGPALLGEAAMRHKSQLRRWGEVPRFGEGHPPIPPVDFAPSLNWPESNAHARTSRYLAIRQTCS
jgi:hypothetical protein